MAAIDNYVAQIRSAVYGKDVREAIAKGIEQCYADSTANAQIARINAAATTAKNSIPADYTNLSNDVAKGFSSSTNYTVGQYVMYNGLLYRFTADHPAGDWIGTDATTSSLGTEVSDLKSALSYTEPEIMNVSKMLGAIDESTFLYETTDFEQGYRHGGTTLKPSTSYVVSKSPIVFVKGSAITPPLNTKYYIVLSDGTIYTSVETTSVLNTYTFVEDVISFLEVYKAGGVSSHTLTVVYTSPIAELIEYKDYFDKELKTSKSVPSSLWTDVDNINLLNCTGYSGSKLYIASKNLLPAFASSSSSSNGITRTYNEDGSIGLSGTSTGVATFEFTRTNMPPVTNGEFVLSIKNNAAIGDSLSYLQLSINNTYSPTHVARLDTINAQYAFKLSETEVITGYRIRVSKGYTFPDDFIIYPQLEEGTEETEFAKPDILTVSKLAQDNYKVLCHSGYNYIVASGTLAGTIVYFMSIRHELDELSNLQSSKFKGKTIVCFGDSITGNYMPPLDYPSMLSVLTGATVYNVAFGGCCMCDNGQTRKDFTMCRLVDSIVAGDFSAQKNSGVSITYGGTSINYVPLKIAVLESIDWSKVDYITIAYGTNDWNSNYAIDNAENKLDTKSYIGAFRYSMEKLLSKYPNIKVLALTPLWRWWDTTSGMPSGETGDFLDANTYAKGTGWYLWNYGNALIEAAKEYHIPVLDMYYNCMMNKFNRYQYFNPTDGTHPKLEGRKLFSEILFAALERTY